jgi:patatin-related protein
MKELRIGLVCYGGVSLAIYMHGVTQELERLIRASRALEAGKEPLDPTERAYYDALQRKTREDGFPTRVLIDAIAGTSAGGINGLFLAKALAQNLSQKGLPEFWFSHGDLLALTDSHSPITASLTAGWHLVRGKPVLDGQAMVTWLGTALDQMDQTPAPPGPMDSLVVPGHSLDLFVTTTDFFGSRRALDLNDGATADGPQVEERSYPQLMHFSYPPGVAAPPGTSGPPGSAFGKRNNPALVFAARSTSSFPVAFQPLDPKDVPGYDADTARQLFPGYRLNGEDPYRALFVDGGLRQNSPFDPVLETMLSRTGGHEVERALIYLEPAPEAPPLVDSKPPHPAAPDDFRVLYGSVVTIPNAQPILGSLRRVQEHNEQVALLNELLEDAEPKATAFALKLLAPEGPGRGSAPGLGARSWNAPAAKAFARRDAMEEHGEDLWERESKTIYLRLRNESILDQFSAVVNSLEAFPEDTDQAALVRQVIRVWAERGGLLGRSADAARQVKLRQDFDLGYYQRRLKVLGHVLDRMYLAIPADSEDPEGERGRIDDLKALLVQAEERLQEEGQGRSLATDRVLEIRDLFAISFRRAQTIRSQAEAFVDAHAGRIDRCYRLLSEHYKDVMDSSHKHLLDILLAKTSNWNEADREPLFAAFAGFPALDAATYPVIRLARVFHSGELRPIKVFRISPVDAKRLSTEGLRKLDGIGLGHFRAFLKRKYRENDYLWGRLDAAERLLSIVGHSSDADYANAFQAILDAEKPNLKTLSRAQWEKLEADTASLRLAGNSSPTQPPLGVPAGKP